MGDALTKEPPVVATEFKVTTTVHVGRKNLFADLASAKCRQALTLVAGSKSKLAQFDADCRLIEQAPALLAELQQFVNGVETGMIASPADETLGNITRRAKAIIAKVKGQ